MKTETVPSDALQKSNYGTSTTVNNSPSQDSNHPDDLFQSRYVTPGFKPFSYLGTSTTVIPPNSNTFSDWRGTCHMPLVKTSWRPRANKASLRPRATTTWTFDSHVIRSCTFETAANLFASCDKKIIFHEVMAAKRFQTRTEEEIEQLQQDKSSKSTNKVTDNAVRTLTDFCKDQIMYLWLILYANYWDL